MFLQGYILIGTRKRGEWVGRCVLVLQNELKFDGIFMDSLPKKGKLIWENELIYEGGFDKSGNFMNGTFIFGKEIEVTVKQGEKIQVKSKLGQNLKENFNIYKNQEYCFKEMEENGKRRFKFWTVSNKGNKQGTEYFIKSFYSFRKVYFYQNQKK